MRTVLIGLCVTVVCLAGVMLGVGEAQSTPPDIKASLFFNDDTYALTPTPPGSDDIDIIMTVANVGATSLFTSASFSDQPFHLRLAFLAPDGKRIIATALTNPALPEPPPPRIYFDPNLNDFVQVTEVEELLPQSDPDRFTVEVTFDAWDFYTFTQAGEYTVTATLPLATYPAAAVFSDGGRQLAPLTSRDFEGAVVSNEARFFLVADDDGDQYAFPVANSDVAPNLEPDCDDANAAVNPSATEVPNNGIDDDCNPSTPDVVDAPTPPGTINVTAHKHTVGGGNHPGATKEPIADLVVRVFDTSASPCFDLFGLSWQHYPSIYESANTCISQATEITDAAGGASASLSPGDYLVIGKCGEACHGIAAGPTIYLGRLVQDLLSGEVRTPLLKFMVKANGKIVPGKYKKQTGSELLIIEPEYVEWDDTEELYPFVFDSIGDWSVTTSVTPPEGFESNHESLSAEVNTALEAVQFTLTDIGSKWVKTKVKHKIKHKGKSKNINSDVGVKLSKKLAKAKGLSQFGDDGPPGLLKKVLNNPQP